MAIFSTSITSGNYGITATDQTGNSMFIDIPVAQGGEGKGVRPMQILLAALCGCSTVDIVNILKKQRQPVEDVRIDIDGERAKNVEPALWETIQINVNIIGEVDATKALRAVDLSIEKYCSVAETLRQAGAKISYTVNVNGVLVK